MIIPARFARVKNFRTGLGNNVEATERLKEPKILKTIRSFDLVFRFKVGLCDILNHVINHSSRRDHLYVNDATRGTLIPGRGKLLLWNIRRQDQDMQVSKPVSRRTDDLKDIGATSNPGFPEFPVAKFAERLNQSESTFTKIGLSRDGESDETPSISFGNSGILDDVLEF